MNKMCISILRLHSEGWLLDVFQRLHAEEGTFFVPLDLEISSQELSYIMKRAEQWRGSNGERRMVSGEWSPKGVCYILVQINSMYFRV